MTEQNIAGMLKRFFQGTISLEEKEILARWVEESGEGDQLKAHLLESWQNFKTHETLSADKANELLDSILIKAKKTENKPAKLVSMYRLKWRRIAVAVSIVLGLGVGAYLIFFGFSAKRDSLIIESQDKRFRNDVSPGRDGAILTLANKQQIILDSAANGDLAQQGNMQIIKKDNQVTYVFNPDASAAAVEHNTMSTPRGRKFELVLADGSKVTLDAESSIRFPTSFVGKERKVEITGQVYFDVTHNEAMPFVVQHADMHVQVLGTKFNVNAYNDESDIKVTLLEGSVNINRQSAIGNPKSVILRPGQQAVLTHNSELITHNSVDLDGVMAWKNGLFNFKGADIKTVMRQIARWYDVDVVYRQEIKEVFYLKLSRNSNVSNVFKILETTGAVHFKIEGKMITVLP